MSRSYYYEIRSGCGNAIARLALDDNHLFNMAYSSHWMCSSKQEYVVSGSWEETEDDIVLEINEYIEVVTNRARNMPDETNTSNTIPIKSAKVHKLKYLKRFEHPDNEYEGMVMAGARVNCLNCELDHIGYVYDTVLENASELFNNDNLSTLKMISMENFKKMVEEHTHKKCKTE